MGALTAIKDAIEAAQAAKKAPQAEALFLAQQRAALPIEKGGLGLPANNTPLQRAKAMGIDTDAFHASKQDITGAFQPGYNDNLAFVTKSPEFANKWIGKGKYNQRIGDQAKLERDAADEAYKQIKYKNMDYETLNNMQGDEFTKEYDRRSAIAKAENAKEFGEQGSPDKIHSTVYPVMVEANKTFDPELHMHEMTDFFTKNEVPEKLQDLYKTGNYMMYETNPVVDYLKSKGYDSMRLRESTGDEYPTLAVFNPETVRSKFAAFDPFRLSTATAATMGVEAPDLLAKEQNKRKGGPIKMGGGGVLKGLATANNISRLTDVPYIFDAVNSAKEGNYGDLIGSVVNTALPIGPALATYSTDLNKNEDSDLNKNQFVQGHFGRTQRTWANGLAQGGRIHLSLKNPKLKEHIQAFGRGGGAHSDAPLSDVVTKGLVPMLAGAGKGAVSGILGAPGDLESMGRSAINALAPQESVLYESNKVSPETFLPTSESIANRLPMVSSDKTAQQVEKFGTSAGSNIAGAMVGPETLLKGKAIGSLADKLKSALNNSGKIKPLEKAYATTQDGPFYRVTPTSVHPSEAVDGGTRQKIWGTNATPDARTARESGSRDAASFSHEALKDVTNDPVQNLPWYLANKKVNEIHGRDYQEPKMPASSLVKQGPIARAFMAGANNEPGYKEAVFKAYQEQHPELVKQAGASNYDELLKASYEQLAKETKDQFNSLPYEFSFHRNGEGNYPSSAHMAADVHGNGHIYVYQGGDKHDFLHEVDPETGLNTNEMFRAVHDVYGHAIHGNQFGPKGEEIAWGAHQQMYSPLAVPAMSAETRGQNSVVNYSPLNAELKKDVNNIEERIQQIKWKGDTPDLRRLQEEKRNLLSTQFQYAPQASVLLPPEMLRPEYNGGMPEYLKPVIKPDPETTAVQNLYHFSHEPSLTETNPNRYGTGIKGAEAQRLEAPNAIKPRTYFYTDPSVTPEAGLGPYKYQSHANDLYNLQADPLKFYTLARETGREPFTAKVNAGVPPTAASVANDVERLANEYGYSGVYDPSSAKPAAAVFNPMPVQRQKRGGLAKENFNG